MTECGQRIKNTALLRQAKKKKVCQIIYLQLRFPLFNVFFSTFMHNDVREFYIGTSIGLLPKATEPKRIYYGIVSVSVFMFFCVLLSVLFVYLENLQISRPSYNAKLHSCSPDTLNKGFPFSPFHHTT